jgi:hypothetical protein
LKLPAVVLSSLVAATALAAPLAADAASLSVSKRCYGPGDKVAFSGGGYTPNGEVAFTVGGQQLGVTTANAVGEISVSLGAPSIEGKQRTDVFTATDQTDLALVGTVKVPLTSLNVTVSPKQGNPGKPRRIKARGFTAGKVLYAHFKLGHKRRNLKIGKLQGPCKTLNVKKQLFASNAPTGLYNVQFDTKRKYSSKTVPQVSFLVNVFQTFKLP